MNSKESSLRSVVGVLLSVGAALGLPGCPKNVPTELPVDPVDLGVVDYSSRGSAVPDDREWEVFSALMAVAAKIRDRCGELPVDGETKVIYEDRVSWTEGRRLLSRMLSDIDELDEDFDFDEEGVREIIREGREFHSFRTTYIDEGGCVKEAVTLDTGCSTFVTFVFDEEAEESQMATGVACAPEEIE